MLQHSATGIDLKSSRNLGHPRVPDPEGMAHVQRTSRLFTAHGILSAARLSKMRSTVPWKLQGATFLLPGSVSVHGLCTTHRSRKLAGHRDVLAGSAAQALSCRNSSPGFKEHPGRRQREPRLAHLRRLSLKFSSVRLDNCTPKTTLEYNSKRPRMPSIPAPSVCVYLYFRGPDSASAKPRSSSTR